MLRGVGISLSVGFAVAMLYRQQPCPICNERTHFLCTRGTCPLCSHGICETEVENVNVSVVCAECALQYFKNEDHSEENVYTVSEFDAIQKFGCLPSALSCLRHGYFLNTEDSVLERRYLRSEVWYLRNLRRKTEVENELGCKLEDIHPLIRHFLLGDYFSKLGKSNTILKDIVMYKKVIHRATEIVKQCLYAHPKAALDFCLMYPAAGPMEFQEMKNKMSAVFHLEGRRILYGLAKNERELLKDGPLGNVFDAFCAEEPDSLIRGYLSKWFSETSVDKIMADDVWRRFDWVNDLEDRVASKLKSFWEGKLRRKAKLMNALTSRGLSIPESCFDCEGYMNGVTTLSLKEIIAVAELTGRLTKWGFRDGDLAWCIGFDRLFRCLKRRKLGQANSVNTAMRAVLQSRKRQ